MPAWTFQLTAFGGLIAGEQKFPAFSLHMAPSLQPQEMFTGSSALKDLAKALAGHLRNAPLTEVSRPHHFQCWSFEVALRLFHHLNLEPWGPEAAQRGKLCTVMAAEG